MAGGHADGPPDGAAKKTVYRVRAGRHEDADGRVSRVAVDDDNGGITVRLLASEGGRRVLRAPAPGWPERTLDAPVEILIRGVAVFAGREV